ncbi:MAG: DnaJ domain-containing protein [Candidatus Omnitrophota bacterium]
MSNKDYYAILGVAENAALDDVKKKYREMAMKYHPDRNQDNKEAAEKRFKDISEAYYVLSDPKRREEYDTFRKYGAGYSGQFTGAQGFDFEEILKAFSGGSGRRYRTARSGRGGFSGGSFESIFDIFNHMGQGDGSEYVYTSQPGGGDGYSAARQDTDVQASLPVPANVKASGGTINFAYGGKKITLNIKPGTKPGQKLRMRGQGKPCPCCGHTGDLIITIK